MENVIKVTDVNDILTQTGLNWGVRKEKLFTADSGITIPKHIALVREDNESILSVMGKDYQPFQNNDLLELLFRVSQMTGFEISRGGFFGNGEKVYVQLKSDNLTLGNDLVEGYLTAINSFDGSTSLAFGASNVTISCMNTFFSAFNQLKNKARHTKNIVTRVDEIAQQLEKVKAEEARIFGDIKLLAESDFKQSTKEMVIRKLFNIKKDVDLEDVESISTRTRNSIDSFKVNLRTEMDDKGENMWGLFSGVTKFTTHTVNQNRKGGYNPNEKMYNFYGKREQAIFHDLVNLSGVGMN